MPLPLEGVVAFRSPVDPYSLSVAAARAEYEANHSESLADVVSSPGCVLCSTSDGHICDSLVIAQ